MTLSENSQGAQIRQHKKVAGGTSLVSSGNWGVYGLHDVAIVLQSIVDSSHSIPFEWDVSDVAYFDSTGMTLLIHYCEALEAQGCTVDIIGMKSEHRDMLSLVRRHISSPAREKPAFTFKLFELFCLLGKQVTAFGRQLAAFLGFIGENFINNLSSLRHPGTIRYGAIVEHIEEAGVRAILIIVVTSFLIGVVIAYQGAVQLEKFGANIFIVDMISISISRELAPLITAIVIAGRTGSSYTAELGAMKITEEVDAMRTMGFDPHRFLVQPRIIALMIVLPLMIFLADVVGIFGGMVIAHLHMHLSYAEFLNRLQHVLDIKQVWIGIIKGPFFAWLIATVGCFYGFQVSSNTESIGRYTTISVVNSIFLVIACDAVFSVILTELGL